MIVVAGEALIDLIVHPDGRLTAVPGGGPFNTARTIARLGVDVAFLGRLSNDRFGSTLRLALAADGVDLQFLEMTDAPTTLAIAELDDRGAATYRFHTSETAAPGLTAETVQRALTRRPDALHVGTLGLVLESMASALAAGIEAAPAATLVMVDPNCRPLAIADRGAYLDRLRRVVRRADIVKVSAEDATYILPGVPFEVAARDLLAGGPSVVLATDGGRAVLVVGRGFVFEVEVPTVPIVDTVGAGDAFGGAFLARWEERELGRVDLADDAAVREAVNAAVEVASLTCQRAGAEPPRRNEVAW